MLTSPLRTLRSISSVIALAVFLIPGFFLAHAQTETVLYNFTGEPDGSYPFAGLVRDGKGNLYGTTTSGGAFNQGAVFVVSKRGAEKVLYSFQGGSDGSYPNGALLRDKAGNLYGTTSFGGGTTACTNGCGTIFQVTPSGDENILYRFTGGSDGSKPQSALIRDAKGNLYGTASGGGDFFWGTVFKLLPAAILTTLYAFTGNLDGGFPYGSLVRDSKGNLYGTTQDMGALYAGTVFEISKSGAETVLYSFAGGSDGEFPQAGLVRDPEGNLYGTTLTGGGSTGCSGSCGTVFKVTPAGDETVLYRFTGGTDGGNPLCVLARDKDGNLYGTTPIAGSSQGTVFEITAGGKQKVLYSFSGAADGANPIGGVIRDGKGNLYGNAYQSGKNGFGAVFKVVP
jgi:uncharacterized repeat protein (TIGR03803 family)